ncbi:hypothetical protein T310_7236 [Rasamsonia emersonii CBS 393.64]|uniref:ShKT domain-containing protein n=1 Tax=Rasamsonia emersonii (strain ATCC 16479 / CBS 393.64 / IMI 116815) TaxID=1408163 RepID=A0A0F4YLR4_RASE3|nr:hypothetical protein T310_7236 [Rasamsonia emersonii CBS 393.64]KKA18796.1 hypothetical protein T310_7236 [Rasamsonia emersonii CBS 393.64]
MRSLLTSPFLLLQAALLASASPAPFPVPAANPAADENCVDISPILCIRYAALCNAPDAEKQIRKDCPRTCGVGMVYSLNYCSGLLFSIWALMHYAVKQVFSPQCNKITVHALQRWTFHACMDIRQGYRQITCVIISATFENKHVTTSRTYSIQSYPYGFKICCATILSYSTSTYLWQMITTILAAAQQTNPWGQSMSMPPTYNTNDASLHNQVTLHIKTGNDCKVHSWIIHAKLMIIIAIPSDL